jgi:hypothetical protein
MASENLGQILFDAEVVADVGALRELLSGGHVKQGHRVLSDRNERIDTKSGPLTIGGAMKIYDWLDYSVS